MSITIHFVKQVKYICIIMSHQKVLDKFMF